MFKKFSFHSKKKNVSGKTFLIIELILIAMIALVLFFLLYGNRSDEKKKVAVIIENSDDEKWTGFLLGIKKAAQDKNLDIDLISSNHIDSVEKAENLLDEAVSAGDKAAIMTGENFDLSPLKKKYGRKIPIILARSGNEGKGSFTEVKCDNYALGKALGDEIKKDLDGNPDAETAGILTGDRGTEAAEERLKGLSDSLKDSNINVLWSLDNRQIDDNSNEVLRVQRSVDIMIGLDTFSLNKAGELVNESTSAKAVIYGIGNSLDLLTYIDEGCFSCLVAPDEFGIGYRSLLKVWERLNETFPDKDDEILSYKVLRKENLFDSDNSEIFRYLLQ